MSYGHTSIHTGQSRPSRTPSNPINPSASLGPGLGVRPRLPAAPPPDAELEGPAVGREGPGPGRLGPPRRGEVGRV